MKSIAAKILLCSALIFVVKIEAFEDATVAFRENGKVHLWDFRTNKLTTVWEGDSVEFVCFGPQGKTLAIQCGQSLFIVSIDGSDVTEYKPDNWPPNTHGTGQVWDYSLGGIFWPMKDGKLYRFNPATKKTSTLNLSGADMGTRFCMAADGRRAYASRRRLITISADFTSAKLWNSGPKGCISGHGNCITGGGKYVCSNSFSGKYDGGCGMHNLGIVAFTDKLVNGPTSNSCNYEGKWCIIVRKPAQWSDEPDMPNPCCGMTLWDGPRQVVNSDDWIIFRNGKSGQEGYLKRHAFVNIHTEEMVRVPVIENNKELNNRAHYSEAWIGPLPTHEGAYIALDKKELSFAGATAAPPSQAVIVSNIGNKPAGTISLSVEPSSATWLKTEIENNNTSKVTITNTVDPAAVGDGTHSATITVSASSAPNKPTYTVRYIKGDIVPPSDLAAAIAGSTKQDAALTWTAAATQGDGYAIERKDAKTDWKEIHRTAADATSYTDAALPLGEYYYRVRTFKGDNFSAYSSEEKIRIDGIESITITSPGTGNILKAGSAFPITWSTNLVSNVEILYSIDDGLTWTPITELGGVDIREASWGNYEWSVPQQNESAVLLQIRDYARHEIFANAGPFAISDTIAESFVVDRVSSANYEAISFSSSRNGSIRLEIREQGPHAIKIYDTRGALIMHCAGSGIARYNLPGNLRAGAAILHVQTNSAVIRRSILLK